MPGKIAIIGGGESGTGAALLASRKGYNVFLSDGNTLKERYRLELQQAGIAFEEGQHTYERILDAEEVIKSPGIPDKAPVMRAITEKGIPVISEIEFAGRHTSARIVGITGTNGKTTTTSLTYHIMKKGGANVRMAGNVGNSFAREIATHDKDCDIYILELSSFQLDQIDRFRVHTAILTNITPDHLDRYDYSLQNYVDAKFRITRNQTSEDYFIYNADDNIIAAELQKQNIVAGKLPYSQVHTTGMAAYTENEKLIINLDNNITDMLLTDLALQGKHNLYNSMAAAVASRLMDIRNDAIREALADFEQIEHRLELVGKVKGIEFINDSKATNVNSAWYALETMYRPVIWIAGGVDKGNDYSALIPLVQEKVKAIICLGTDNSPLIEAFGDKVDTIVETQSMQEAVKAGYYMGKPGDVVLLAPACASFDLFENYEDRGRQFKKFVREL